MKKDYDHLQLNVSVLGSGIAGIHLQIIESKGYKAKRDNPPYALFLKILNTPGFGKFLE